MEDIRRLIVSEPRLWGQSPINWNEKIPTEDSAILWALMNGKLGIVDILMPVNKINLQGDSSADLTISCDTETFRVHKYFLSAKSLVFNAMLNIGMKEARKAVVNIKDINSSTLTSLIHFVYTGELAEGWKELDIEDMANAATKYDLAGWIDLLCSALKKEVVSGKKVAELIIVGSMFQDSAARQLRMVARDKIKERKEITEDLGFRERLRMEDYDVLFEFLPIISQ